MIARVLTLTPDVDRVRCSVGFYDNSDPQNPVELDVHEFVWERTAIAQQIKADVIAWGKSLNDRVNDMNRLQQALTPGTEFVI